MRLRELIEAKELLRHLTLRELRTRYRRSVLGWMWSLLNPLSTMLIFWVVFSVFGAAPPTGDPSGLTTFPLYFLSGILPWNFFLTTVSGSMGALIGNGSLIKKVAFPKEVLVFSTTFSGLTSLAIELGILSAILAVVGNWRLIIYFPALLLTVALLAIFSAGLGLLFASLNVFFRDIGYLWNILAQGWFYVTPIIYTQALLDQRPTFARLVRFNPMSAFVISMRNVLYDLRWPSAMRITVMVVVASVSLAVGLGVFARLAPRFAEEL